MGSIKLKLEKGLLEERTEDAIVNSTNAEFDLQRNASAKALAAAAGPELQKGCRALGPLGKGQVKVSEAYELPCRSVLHCWIGNMFNGKQSEKELETVIMEGLRVADKELQYKCIAFPALGAGKLKFPADIVARYFKRCTKKYTPETLSEVCVVILPADKDIYETFSRVFNQPSELKWKPSEHFMDKLEESIGNPLLILNVDSEEYMQVEDNFRKTIPSNAATILEITRVQNFSQWVKYKENRRHVSKKYAKFPQEVERVLWHGTSEDAIPKIAGAFFNRSYARSQVTCGKGVYFARDASFSDNDKYFQPNEAGEKYLLQARVIVGKFTKGNGDLKDTPSDSDGSKYDSVVNNEHDPTMFVVFEDAAAYPEYIIKYTKRMQ